MYKSNSAFTPSSSSHNFDLSNRLSHDPPCSTGTRVNNSDSIPSQKKTLSPITSSKAIRSVPIVHKSRVEGLPNGTCSSTPTLTNRNSSHSSSNGSLNSNQSDSSSLKRPVNRDYDSLTSNFAHKATINYRTEIKPMLFPKHDGAISHKTQSSSYSCMNNSRANTSSNHSRSSNLHERGLIGLKNLGNTCFMNSVIQCLSNTPELLLFCINKDYYLDLNKSSSMKGLLFQSYAELMNELWSNSQASFSDSVSPYSFKNQIQKFAPRFMGYSQQDAQEFLRYLLEGLHEDVNRIKIRPKPEIADYDKEDKLDDQTKSELYWNRYLKRDNSMIVDLFMGQLMSTLECTECGFKSTTFDPFWDLSLPIAKKSSIDILDCLRLFTSKEELNGVEKPMCGRCKQRRRCHKWFNIQRFPSILVLHLKRFSGERFRSKMSGLVSYPCDRLDLSEFASPTCTNRSSTKYRLYAVSNHSGGCYGGHYTAYCRHPDSGRWYEYNDSRVRQIDENSVISAEGYVLFYAQIS